MYCNCFECDHAWRVLVSVHPDRCLQQETLDLSSSQVTPVFACPGLRSRWCPSASPWRAFGCCLPNHQLRRLSAVRTALFFQDTAVHISGFNTLPANSLHPASDTVSRRSPTGSLLDLLARRWSRWDSHPLGNINQFVEFLLSLILSLAGHDDGLVMHSSSLSTLSWCRSCYS